MTTDPLDELRSDDRDNLSPPTGFAPALGTMRMREPDEVGEGVRRGQVYWTYGSAPKGAPQSDVDDPPCSGWSSVFVLDGPTPEKLILFHPWSFRSYVVGRRSYEASSLQGCVEGFEYLAREFYKERLPNAWIALKKHGQEAHADYRMAERVMLAVGCKPPTDEQVLRAAPSYRPPEAKKSGGSAPEAPFKPVKRGGRRGEVLEAILAGTTSAEALTAQFSITRSNLLSQLFLLRKEHGIGYTVSGDEVGVQVPEGVTEVFA